MDKFLEIGEELQDDAPLKNTLDKLISYNFSEKDYGTSRRFLGAHPINMSKEHLDLVCQNTNDFLLCEKSDGIRYLMIVLSNGYIFFHGRYSGSNYESKKQYFRIKDLEYFSNREESIQLEHIFDGELIENHEKKLFFLLFDTLLYKKNKVFSKYYNERLNFAKYFYTQVMDVKLFNQLKGNITESRILIKLKDFYSPLDVKYLLKDYVKSLNHENDGLIFTKISLEYISGQNDSIYKWKPSHLTTIDFLLIPNPKLKETLKCQQLPMELYLFYEKDNVNIYEFFDFLFCENHEQEILIFEEYQREQFNSKNTMNLGLIAECSYNLTENILMKSIFEGLNDDQTTTLIRKILLNCSINNNSLEKAISSFKETLEDYKKANFIGNWSLLRTRNDKSRPNSVAIGRNVVKVIRDNIDESNLTSRLGNLKNGKNIEFGLIDDDANLKKVKLY